MSSGAIQGDYGHSNKDSVNYGHKYTPQKTNKINVFGNNNDSNYLNKVLERNGGIVPIGSGAIRH